MSELLDVFSKDGKKIGTIDKREYYGLKTDDIPWIKACSCFVIDAKEKNILFEKRGNLDLDAGKVDLCSGHIRSGEIPEVAMVRELEEELGIPVSSASNVRHLGDVTIDYTKLSDETNRKNLKCVVSLFALKLQDIHEVNIDNNEVIRCAWLSEKDAISFIKNSMTRIPYEKELEKPFEKIFERLSSFIKGEKNREESQK